MRSAVGAVCILDLAEREAAAFFFALALDEPDFTGVTVFFVCDVGFALVDFAPVDCTAAEIIAETHKPPASKNPPAARRIILCDLLINAPHLDYACTCNAPGQINPPEVPHPQAVATSPCHPTLPAPGKLLPGQASVQK